MIAADQFKPVARAIKSELLKLDYLHGDETRIEVQDPDHPANIKQGQLWTLLGPPGIYYEYNQSRSGDVARELLGDYKQYFQCDDYAAYDQCPVIRLACWAHVRRRFKDAPDTAEKTKVLCLIAELYRIEEKAKATPEKKLELRQQKSLDILKKIKEYLDYINTAALPKALLGEAARYALNQWTELCRYTERADFNIDNNPIERQMKSIAVGRKNWLFAGSHRGAQAAAIFFTLINSAKLAGINPAVYISNLFIQIQSHPINRVAELIPSNWAKNLKTMQAPK